MQNTIRYLIYNNKILLVTNFFIFVGAINTVVQLLLGFVLQKSDVNYKPVNIEQVTTTNNDKS